MAEFIKATTGLTRLVVSKNPHHTLTSLYGKTLRALAKMPPTAAYRIHTEKIITERARIVANNQNVGDVENKINCGQIEEVIVQAENELLLARKMLGWKPWEPLATAAPPQQWDWPPAQIKSLSH
ncbi:NADH dehydrogenase [ubiquinone] 1 alpha subcomplex subunit 5 [Bradysia coprophila]|uniref:NADH dehydrogenase [ubiquinone] 1 alpha subcomplex subunit 5 n=1 Tax=Bradysia coprophila TaxID=38358 RepID=UPI00187D73D8|nr:NADH dehydrogenase [ubiquinone] 1 alpha subcomplex subunit 5 [Bradysia coprophila]